MRIWHEQLIPKLCRQHLLAIWREGLGCYKIITENRTELSYWKHPATQEFVDAPNALWCRLKSVRDEMIARKYHPKPLPELICKDKPLFGKIKEWQSLEQQIEIIRSKKCNCNI